MATAGAAPAPRLPAFGLLVAVTATGPVAMHLFIPSMPGLVAEFSTTLPRVQLTLTLYMVALAVATLAYGPLSDRFGRRPVLLAGLAIYAVAAVLCAFAPSMVTIMGRAPSEYGLWFIPVAVAVTGAATAHAKSA